MITRLLQVVLFILLISVPLIVSAITEQEVEDEIDYQMGARSFVHSKIEAAGTSANPVLLQLLQRHQKETNRQRIILNFMGKYPEESMIKPVLDAYHINNEIEGDVINLLLEINTDEAYLAALGMAFNPQVGRDVKGYEPINDIRLVLSKTTQGRLQYVIPLVKERKGMVLEAVLDTMIDVGKPEMIVPPIAELLKAESSFTRITAIEALGKIGDRSAIPALKEAMKSEKDIGLKMDIAAQLVKLGEFNELELLIQAVGNRSKDIRDGAVIWLQEVTGQGFGENQAVWRQWFEDEKKRRGL